MTMEFYNKKDLYAEIRRQIAVGNFFVIQNYYAGVSEAPVYQLTAVSNKDGGKAKPTYPGDVVVRTSKWVVTDPSCAQRRRIHTYDDGTKTYEFEQTIDGLHGSATIDLNDYLEGANEKETAELKTNFEKEYLAPYGYDSLEFIKKTFGKHWEEIAAECIFETDFYEIVND